MGGGGTGRFTVTVVAVDDEADILAVIRKGVETDGFGVETFTNAKSALDFIRGYDRKPEQALILLSDVRMPGMNGFELTRTVRTFCPKIAVALMTAFEIDKREFDKVMPSTAVDAFITKPFSLDKLKMLIGKLKDVAESNRGINTGLEG
jgi:CheY-like chemotaxis protein